MRCVALRHVAFEDLGLFEPALTHRGYKVEYVQAGLHVLSELDWAPVSLTAAGASSPLRHLAGLDMLHWHGDAFDLPYGTTLLASTHCGIGPPGCAATRMSKQPGHC